MVGFLSQIGNLIKIVHMDMYSCGLSSSVPPQMRHLVNFEHMQHQAILPIAEFEIQICIRDFKITPNYLLSPPID